MKNQRVFLDSYLKESTGSVTATLSCALDSHGVGSSSDRKDVEQLIDEAHLVIHLRLAGEARTSTDPPHHLEVPVRSRSRLHHLQAVCGLNDSFESIVGCFDKVVQVRARAMLHRR